MLSRKLIYKFLFVNLVFTLFLLGQISCYSQEMENFLNSVVYIRWQNFITEYNPAKDKFFESKTFEYGTGFFIEKDVQIKDSIYKKKFLITNKHVLPAKNQNVTYIELRVYTNSRENLNFIKLDL